jgi:SagB-type dehydrogenase family enzyme
MSGPVTITLGEKQCLFDNIEPKAKGGRIVDSQGGDVVKRILLAMIFTAYFGGGMAAATALSQPGEKGLEVEADNNVHIIKLPEPKYDGEVSVERALLARRSVKEDTRDEPLTLSEVSQLLWAAQGITDTARGLRTAPSAGATYPLEVYLVVGSVAAAKPGAYKYSPRGHRLIQVKGGDVRAELAAALGQSRVGKAGAVIVFFAVYERTTAKFGEIGIRYVHMEVGHAAQNVYLQAGALKLGTCVIGGFPEPRVKSILNVPDTEHLLYIMPVGRMGADGPTGARAPQSPPINPPGAG